LDEDGQRHRRGRRLGDEADEGATVRAFPRRSHPRHRSDPFQSLLQLGCEVHVAHDGYRDELMCAARQLREVYAGRIRKMPLVREPTLLGLLPALGGSLRDFARHGQEDRLLSYYFPAYLERFERVRFFSYENERLGEITTDRELLARVDVLPAAAAAPRRAGAVAHAAMNGRALRACGVVRVLQAPGALPAALAGARYVPTYGYSYAAFTTAPTRAFLAVKRAAITAGLRPLLRRAYAVVATTADGEREARSLGARDIWRIPNGVDTDLFAPARDDRDIDVVFVGRLVEQKDLATLLRALARLVTRPTLTIVGDGELRQELELQARALHVRAKFVGNRPQPEVAALLRRARCFALPSRIEGHPKALLEAMAAGVPWVGSDIPPLRELATASERQLVAVGDDAALAAVVESMLADDERSSVLGRAGRERAVGDFDLRRLLARETELLAVAAR